MADVGREAACAHVYRHYPALCGVKPRVLCRAAHRMFVFEAERETSPGGRALRHAVRVTVDSSGRIVKVVAAR